MYFINACSTISHQQSFQNKEWINELKKLSSDHQIIPPNYKDYINGGALRRMSKIIRMGLVCSKDCIEQSGKDNPDAIIVGTGLGCLQDTEKFLNNILTIKGLIPPTSFIQSTHNTIAGQISLDIKNHNYNMTHTQNSLSFEHALIDAMLCLNEDGSNVIVGAADESIPILEDLAEQFKLKEIQNKLTSGASFFMLSNKLEESSCAKLVDCLTIGLNDADTKSIIVDFLKKNNLSLNEIDLVLSNSFGTVSKNEIKDLFDTIAVLPFEDYSGYYYTNSAFGMHLGSEMLRQNKKKELTKEPIKRVLIFNNLNNSNIGLTLLQSLET
jgi:hypothetical protein